MDGGELQTEFKYMAHSCLYNEAPIKTLDTQAYWSFLIDEYNDVLGGQHIHKERAWKLCVPLTAQTMPHASLQFLIDILSNKTVIISGFSKFYD